MRGFGRLSLAGPPKFSCATGGAGFRGWGTGARGSALNEEANLPPERGSRSGLAVNGVESTAFSPTPHSGGFHGGSRGVKGARVSESLRPRVRARTGRTCWLVLRPLDFPRPWGGKVARPSALPLSPTPPPFPVLRRLRTHWRRFLAAGLRSHVAPRAFSMGIAGTAGLSGDLMDPKVAFATTLLPHRPYDFVLRSPTLSGY